EIVPGQIITRWVNEPPRTRDGQVVADPSRDLLKLTVVERHKATGNIGVGLVKGFGLKRGAFASSVAHDSHNIVCVGASDEDIHAVAKEIERLNGGLAVAVDGKVLGSLGLPIAGLLSDRPLEEVATRLEELESFTAELGCTAPSPFSILSFVALPVVPELKLSDRGLVDVGRMRLIDLAEWGH
ncbi:MAG: adenine deaminase, partial [SAR202 cluster bacterium]|nr:adenine deaminase [SAR202 cluster bacterium]